MNTFQQPLIDRVFARFDAYSDLASSIDANLLAEKIDIPKHKSLLEHLWCVVGARESYTVAIGQGAWSGFACSMQSYEPEDFRVSLQKSAAAATETINSVTDWTPERAGLLIKLAEHEVMHEGQIIRHMYALEKPLPDSWEWA